VNGEELVGTQVGSSRSLLVTVHKWN